jgi:hypothetical protein
VSPRAADSRPCPGPNPGEGCKGHRLIQKPRRGPWPDRCVVCKIAHETSKRQVTRRAPGCTTAAGMCRKCGTVHLPPRSEFNSSPGEGVDRWEERLPYVGANEYIASYCQAPPENQTGRPADHNPLRPSDCLKVMDDWDDKRRGELRDQRLPDFEGMTARAYRSFLEMQHLDALLFEEKQLEALTEDRRRDPLPATVLPLRRAPVESRPEDAKQERAVA